MRSASSIGGVAVRADQQRNMEMRFAGAGVKRDFDKRIQSADSLRSEIGSGVKGEAVEAFGESLLFGEQVEAAAVGIGLCGRKLAPGTAGFAEIETQRNGWSRLTARGVQDMSGDAIHRPSHFFRRSWVIWRCCSAASRSSLPASLCILRRRISRISAADLPVAHTMKM